MNKRKYKRVMMKKKPEIKHFGDCSIYALNCFICDCGAFRRLMPDIDIVDMKTIFSGFTMILLFYTDSRTL